MRSDLWISSIILTWILVGPAGAETLYLKNGLKITGTIVEHKEKYTKVNVSGVDVTYYSDEIDHMEGVPVQVAPVPQTVPVSSKAIPASAVSPAASAALVPSTASQSKEKLILEFMEVSGTRQAMQELMDEIVTQVPPEQAAKLRQSVKLNQLLSRLVPVYDKYFSEEEIIALISFQKSPVGEKLIKVTARLMEDSVQAALGYIKEAVPELGKER